MYSALPKVISVCPENNIDSLKQPNFKYAELDYAYPLCDKKVQTIIDKFSIIGQHTFTLLDVKYVYLKPGWASCLLGWHIDCTKDLNHPAKPELHHLWFSGCGVRTKFLSSPVKEITKIMPTWYAPEQHYIQYNRGHLHSTDIAIQEGWRLLVRVTECDFISPINTIKNVEPNKSRQRLNF